MIREVKKIYFQHSCAIYYKTYAVHAFFVFYIYFLTAASILLLAHIVFSNEFIKYRWCRPFRCALCHWIFEVPGFILRAQYCRKFIWKITHILYSLFVFSGPLDEQRPPIKCNCKELRIVSIKKTGQFTLNRQPARAPLIPQFERGLKSGSVQLIWHNA